MVELSYFALILLITCCVAAGVCAAVVNTWSLRASMYEVSDRLTVLEGTLTREVKARAGAERWKKPDKDKELISELVAQTPAQVPKMNWWQTGLPRSVPK